MIALCALLSACGNPSGPSKRSYDGQWTGTTAQGKTVAFTISPDENVTAINQGKSSPASASALRRRFSAYPRPVRTS